MKSHKAFNSRSRRKRSERKQVAVEIAATLQTQEEVALTRYQLKPFATSQDVVFDTSMKEHFIRRIEQHLKWPVEVTAWRHENDNYNLGPLLEAVVRVIPLDELTP